jgi:hypothetical protein
MWLPFVDRVSGVEISEIFPPIRYSRTDHLRRALSSVGSAIANLCITELDLEAQKLVWHPDCLRFNV